VIPNSLAALGWDSDCAVAFRGEAEAAPETALAPGRITFRGRNSYRAVAPAGGKELNESEALSECEALLPGRLQFGALPEDLPAVGDWVALQPLPGEATAVIHAILPRRSAFARTGAGGPDRQIVASNVDVLGVVIGADGSGNPVRRAERYLVMAREGGAWPLIILNKRDLLDVQQRTALMQNLGAIAGDASLVETSAEEGEAGVAALRAFLNQTEKRLGRAPTLAFAGSSGGGKSSLANALLGREQQKVQAVRSIDGKGRHTTTTRELLVLPDGGCLLDTPGMRELQLSLGEGGALDAALDASFDDVAVLARRCRFPDCYHENEPDCAVQAAIAADELNPERLQSWRKLQAEREYLLSREDRQAHLDRKESVKRLRKHYRRVQSENRRNKGRQP